MHTSGFQTMLESAPDAIVLALDDGRISLVNKRTEELFGYSREELKGQPVEVLIPERFREDHLTHRAGYAADPRTRVMGAGLDLRGRRKDGSEFPVEISLSPMWQDDQLAVIAFVRDVTERRAAEKRFRALLESAPDAILLVDSDGRITLTNRQVQALFGFTPGELLGEHVERLVPERFRQAHLRHRARYGADPHTREMDAGMELYALRKDGSEFPVEISLSPVEQGGETMVTTIIRDVSERRAAERERLALAREQAAHVEAQAANERVASILAGIDAIVWEADGPERNEFTFVSHGAVDILGHPLERWSNAGFWLELMHPDDRQVAVAFFRETATKRERHELEYRVIAADGRVVWIRDLVHTVESHTGGSGPVRGVMVDVTERRELETRLIQSQKLEAVGQLAGGVAHDFNNLLTVITGYAALAEGKDDARVMGDELAEIQRATKRAQQLTEQLLTFSRRSPRSEELVEVNELVSRVEAMMTRLIDEDIRVTIRLGEQTEPVRADPAQLEQVLVNLVVNARDAMPRGGEIRVETTMVHVDERGATEREIPPGRYAVLVVSDTGEGMSDEVRARIFDPFFTTKAPGKGSGLGLATVYGIVEQAGGRIAVTSEIGRGTDFAVYLPMAEIAVTPEAEEPPVPRTTGPTVLLVEDEPALRQLARQVLERAEYRVISASNGREALDVAERFRGSIELLITDVVMPDVGGLELAERLGRLRPELKVLYMSGYADSRLARQGLAESDIDLLRKPFAPSELAGRVERLIEAHGR